MPTGGPGALPVRSDRADLLFGDSSCATTTSYRIRRRFCPRTQRADYDAGDGEIEAEGSEDAPEGFAGKTVTPSSR